MSQALERFLERARRESYQPAAHQLLLTLGRTVPDQMETLLRELAPSAAWLSQDEARYALDGNGHGLRVGRDRVGGTPDDAVNHHFTLHLPRVTVTTIVAEGYMQPEVMVIAEAQQLADLEGLSQHFSALSTRHFRFGPASVEDLGAVVGLIRGIFEQEYDIVFDHSFDTPDIAGADRFFVLHEGQMARACCALWLYPEQGELKTLYVHNSLRRLGWGGRLVNLVREHTRQSGRPQLELWSDTRFLAAHRLYRRLGFQQAGERELQDVNQSREYRFFQSL